MTKRGFRWVWSGHAVSEMSSAVAPEDDECVNISWTALVMVFQALVRFCALNCASAHKQD